MSEKRIAAVDIGGTKMAAGLVDKTGHIVARGEVPTVPEGTFDAAMDRLTGLVGRLVRESGSELEGIGVGCTGPVDPFTGKLGNVNHFPHWEGGALGGTLEASFGVTVAVENDADAATLAEAVHGAGQGYGRVVCVTVGTGIGTGVVIDGRLYRGAGGFHPEIGHHVIEASGPLCSCGARGCWEALACGPAISAWFRENAPAGAAGPDITTREIYRRAHAGDEWSLKAVERQAFYLGVGLANIVTVFAPDVIALGGGVMESAAFLLPRMDGVVRQYCRLVPVDGTRIVLAGLGADLGFIGAAEVWRHRFEPSGGKQ